MQTSSSKVKIMSVSNHSSVKVFSVASTEHSEGLFCDQIKKFQDVMFHILQISHSFTVSLFSSRLSELFSINLNQQPKGKKLNFSPNELSCQQPSELCIKPIALSTTHIFLKLYVNFIPDEY